MTATVQSPLVDGQTAHAYIHNEVYATTFFNKLANDFGIVPETQEERQYLLKIGMQVRAAAERQKAASVGRGVSFLKAASNDLARALGQAPQQTPSADAEVDQAIIKYAAHLATNTDLARAVISMRQAG